MFYSVKGLELGFRDATTEDADAVAALHADSWRRNYRGAYRDSYLDGDVFEERQEVWRARLRSEAGDRFTVVAIGGHEVVGFVHMVMDHDPQWGSLLDNLHVQEAWKRKGIGAELVRQAAGRLVVLRPGTPAFYLWVLAQNVAAQRFYEALGGRLVETAERGPFPGGGSAMGHRMAWDDARSLLGPH